MRRSISLFIDSLKSPDVGVTTVRGFAACAVSKDKVEPDIIDASGVALNYGEKVKVRLTWEAATNLVNSGQGSMGAGSAPNSQSKMPNGTEQMLRKEWKARHAFNLSGGG